MPPLPRIACLWLPNWPIQRLIAAQPDLRRQRIVLFRTDSRRGRLVAATSPLALRDGIRSGMPLSEAKSLLTRCGGDFHIFEHDPAADFVALEELADTLDRFSPIVGLETLAPAALKRNQQPASILLDVTGIDRLFGNETKLAEQLQQYAQSVGYLSQIALANTVGVAWGTSRFLNHRSLKNHSENVPWLILPPDDTQTFGQLPIETLRLEPTTVATLHQLGIETNEQLWRLSRADLARRFGDEIHRRIDQTTGHIEEPVIARRKPPEYQSQQLLDHPTNHRETIEVIIARLITGICEQLRSCQTGALQWKVSLFLVDDVPLDFTVNLFQPTATLNQIMPLIEMQLEQLLTPSRRASPTNNSAFRVPHSAFKNLPTSPSNLPPPITQRRKTTNFQVQEIQISVTACVLLVEHQRQLFDENPRLDKQALAQLINRLSTRLGQQNVVYPQLQAGAQPEFSYRFRPLVDLHRPRSRRRTKPRPQSHVAARPLRIFQPAVRISMRNSECGMRNAELTGLSFRTPHSEFCIQAALGPERIETGWWRGRTVCRDYWRIETDRGQQFWLYRDLRAKEWFLQGEF